MSSGSASSIRRVRTVALQPVTHSGRHVKFDPLTRLTNSDVIELVADQCPDWLRSTDFFPVPRCFPTCRSITYLLVGRKADHTDVVPIPRLINPDEYLDYVTNRVCPTRLCARRRRSCRAPRRSWARTPRPAVWKPLLSLCLAGHPHPRSNAPPAELTCRRR